MGSKEMPEWLEEKIKEDEESIKFHGYINTYFPLAFKKGFVKCFELLNPKINRLEKQLELCKKQRNGYRSRFAIYQGRKGKRLESAVSFVDDDRKLEQIKE